MTAQETQARAASEPNSIPEQKTPENILDSKSVSIYGRLYIAAIDDGADLEMVLNPEIKINLPSEPPSENFFEKPQNYNNITWGLSKNERTNAWKDVSGSFEDKKKKWNENLRASISVASDARKLVITHFTGKDSSPTEDEINATLYETFCNGESNVSGFVKKALEKPDIDFAAVEWLAIKLFGKESGKVVKKILELEFSISRNEKATFDFLFSDPDKVNNPTEYEIELLSKLRDGYLNLADDEKKKIKTTQPNADEPQPKNTPKETEKMPEKPNDDGKIRARMILGSGDNPDEKYYIKGVSELALVTQLKVAIDSVREGKATLDPTTGNLLEITSSDEIEDTVSYLMNKIDEIKANQNDIEDLDREIEIIRISDRESMELPGFTKRDLMAIFGDDKPKYERYKYERHKVLLKDNNHTYTIQSYYDRENNKVKIRFYRRPNMSNENHEIDKEREVGKFEEMFSTGEVNILGVPIQTPDTTSSPTIDPEPNDRDEVLSRDSETIEQPDDISPSVLYEEPNTHINSVTSDDTQTEPEPIPDLPVPRPTSPVKTSEPDSQKNPLEERQTQEIKKIQDISNEISSLPQYSETIFTLTIIGKSEIPELDKFIQEEIGPHELNIHKILSAVERITEQGYEPFNLDTLLKGKRQFIPILASRIANKRNQSIEILNPIPDDVYNSAPALKTVRIPGLGKKVDKLAQQQALKRIEPIAENISQFMDLLSNIPNFQEQFMNEVSNLYFHLNDAENPTQALRDFIDTLHKMQKNKNLDNRDYPLFVGLTRLIPMSNFKWDTLYGRRELEAAPEIATAIYRFLKEKGVDVSSPSGRTSGSFTRMLGTRFKSKELKNAEAELPHILNAIYEIIPQSGPEFSQKMQSLFEKLATTTKNPSE